MYESRDYIILLLGTIDCDVWKDYLGDEDDLKEKIRTFTMTGKPLGSLDFILEVGKKLGREIGLRAKGRPRNEIK